MALSNRWQHDFGAAGDGECPRPPSTPKAVALSRLAQFVPQALRWTVLAGPDPSGFPHPPTERRRRKALRLLPQLPPPGAPGWN